MTPTQKWVPLGKVLREWGVRGQVKCACFNPESRLFQDSKKLYLKFSEGYRPLEVEDSRPHDEYWRIKFKGFDSPETAKGLRGLLIGLPREELPELDRGEVYISDLKGLRVKGPEGKILGTVQGVQKVGESEVLWVGEGLEGSVGIPYEAPFIAGTDLGKGVLVLTELALDLFDL